VASASPSEPDPAPAVAVAAAAELSRAMPARGCGEELARVLAGF